MVQKRNDQIEFRTIPLPPEQRAAWKHSMRLLTQMLIEILHENANGERLKAVSDSPPPNYHEDIRKTL